MGLAGQLEVRGVTLAGPDVGVSVEGAQVRLRSVNVSGATGVGLHVAGATASLEVDDVFVESMSASDFSRGEALLVQLGGQLLGRRVSVSGARSSAALVMGSTLQLSDSLVSGTLADDDGRGFGVGATESSISLERLVVTGAEQSGLSLMQGGATLTDVVVRDVRHFRPFESYGVRLWGVGAPVSVTRLLVEDVAGHGLNLAGAGDTEVREVVVRRTGHWAVMCSARGPRDTGDEPGTFRLAHVRVDDADVLGIGALGGDTSLELSDAHVSDTHATDTLWDGVAVWVGAGARLSADRLLVTDADNSAVHLERSQATLRDLKIEHTRCVTGHYEDAIGVDEFSLMTIERALVRDAAQVGSFVWPGCELRLTDVVFDGVRECPVLDAADDPEHEPWGGMAIFSDKGRVVAERVRIRDASRVAVFAGTARLDLTDTLIEETRPDSLGHYGVAAMSVGSQVFMRRSVVRGTHEAGLVAYLAARLDLEDVVVRDVASTGRGAGMGIVTVFGAEALLERVAVVDVQGAAMAAISGEDLMIAGTAGNAAIRGTDVYTARISTSPVRLDLASDELVGAGVSYALHTGARCEIDLERATLTSGGYGFFAAPRTTRLALRQGLITGMLDAAGADAGRGEETLRLEGVRFDGNANNGVVLEAGLPEASALPAPTPVERPE
jgi:hypothetical protein